MSITVYYTEASNIFMHAPELVLNNLQRQKNQRLLRCPAFTDSLKNTYLIRSLHTYSLTLDGDRVYADSKGQQFFDQHVFVRDANAGMCSFFSPKLFFFSEQPLVMEQTTAIYHENKFTDGAMLIGGQYNIGKHFRPVETAFYFKAPNKVSFVQDEPIYYVKFHTKEKIKFVPFQFTEDIKTLTSTRLGVKNPNKIIPLSRWYDITEKFYKKRLLKLIKESLL